MASLTSVAQAFDTEDPQEGPSKKDPEDERGRADPGDLVERDDHAHVRGRLVAALAKLGCEWVAGKLFPWKGFSSKLAKSGVVCHGWPDNVLLPGEDQQPRFKGGSKGISDLTLAECSSLYAALNDTSKQRLQFKFATNPKDLTSSRFPVIICAAPAADSPYPHGRRMFANLNIDRKGPQRLANTAVTRVKKNKKRSQPRPVETITIIDSDDIVEVPPPQKKSLESHPSPDHNSTPKEAPAAAPQKRQTRGKVEVLLTKKSIRKVSNQSNVLDLSSESGSEYEPDVGKVVASTRSDDEEPSEENLSDGIGPSTHAQKKRVKSANGTQSKDKGKGKMQSGGGCSRNHPFPRRVASRPRLPFSEDEDEFSADQGHHPPPTNVGQDTCPSLPCIQLEPPKESEIPMPSSGSTHSTINASLVSALQPRVDIGEPRDGNPACPSDSLITQPVVPSTLAQVPPDVSTLNPPQSTQRESVTSIPETTATAPPRPKPRPYVKRVHDSDGTSDDPFSLRKKVQLSSPALDSPSSTCPVAAKEGINTSEAVQERPAEQPAALTSAPELNCPPAVTHEGRQEAPPSLHPT
ncbi:hypothetical protein JVT61DRAFT_15507 [Boletus reticuloceps]|uniref:Uncharacterized protein n=1 Tax=Boletus reticuloceps TaxID=495285 RepID=A0A8I2YCE4_9AGAM|nr:hypothetical protein JVT61DRAFT_15507 [Boletus reticuloceps]